MENQLKNLIEKTELFIAYLDFKKQEFKKNNIEYKKQNAILKNYKLNKKQKRRITDLIIYDLTNSIDIHTYKQIFKETYIYCRLYFLVIDDEDIHKVYKIQKDRYDYYTNRPTPIRPTELMIDRDVKYDIINNFEHLRKTLLKMKLILHHLDQNIKIEHINEV